MWNSVTYAENLSFEDKSFAELVAQGTPWHAAARRVWGDDTDVELHCKAEQVMSKRDVQRYFHAVRGRGVLLATDVIRGAFMRLELLATSADASVEEKIRANDVILRHAMRATGAIGKVFQMLDPDEEDDEDEGDEVSIRADAVAESHGILTGQVIDVEASG